MLSKLHIESGRVWLTIDIFDHTCVFNPYISKYVNYYRATFPSPSFVLFWFWFWLVCCRSVFVQQWRNSQCIQLWFANTLLNFNLDYWILICEIDVKYPLRKYGWRHFNINNTPLRNFVQLGLGLSWTRK